MLVFLNFKTGLLTSLTGVMQMPTSFQQFLHSQTGMSVLPGPLGSSNDTCVLVISSAGPVCSGIFLSKPSYLGQQEESERGQMSCPVQSLTSLLNFFPQETFRTGNLLAPDPQELSGVKTAVTLGSSSEQLSERVGSASSECGIQMCPQHLILGTGIRRLMFPKQEILQVTGKTSMPEQVEE